MNFFTRLNKAVKAAQVSMDQTRPPKPVKYIVVYAGKYIEVCNKEDLLSAISRTNNAIFNVYQVKNIDDKVANVLKKELKNYDGSSTNDRTGAALSST